MNPALRLASLEASVGGRQILKVIDLELPFGEVHAVMGPNGSGKSTLCHVLSGRPGYEASGAAAIDGKGLLGKPVVERARLGLVQCFQYPIEIRGVKLGEFRAEAAEGAGGEDAGEVIARAAERIDMTRSRPVRYDDLSGGEKVRRSSRSRCSN